MPDGRIDLRMSARCIHNLVRALGTPYVGAHFLCEGREVKVWKTEIVDDVARNLEPGKILEVTARGAVVRCGEQGVRLLKTEPGFSPAPGQYL
jgi:methionyl-tRNA formyltransferase